MRRARRALTSGHLLPHLATHSMACSLFEKRSNIIAFWVGKLKHCSDFACLHKMVEKLSESSELEEILKLVQEVAIKNLSQISSIET